MISTKLPWPYLRQSEILSVTAVLIQNEQISWDTFWGARGGKCVKWLTFPFVHARGHVTLFLYYEVGVVAPPSLLHS